jgi:putative transposase
VRKEVAEDLRTIFNAPDQATAEAYLARAVAKCARTASKPSAWMEESIPEGFSVYFFPKEHWRRLWVTNGLERISRRDQTPNSSGAHLPERSSPPSIVSAILMEISEERETGRVYLTTDDDA